MCGAEPPDGVWQSSKALMTTPHVQRHLATNTERNKDRTACQFMDDKKTTVAGRLKKKRYGVRKRKEKERNTTFV